MCPIAVIPDKLVSFIYRYNYIMYTIAVIPAKLMSLCISYIFT